MLYYIIPPIIIVIATAVLIYFLFKKAEQTPLQEIPANDLPHAQESKSTRFKEAINNTWLRVMERIMHRAKLMSLKFHNISNERFHAIRKKRQEIIEQEKDQMVQVENDSASEKGDIEKLKPAPMKMDGASQIVRSQDMEQKPLVKKDIVRPDSAQTRMVAKNQLEDALIKRIAVNPRDIEAYERLGDYYFETGNSKDALECFRQVLRLNPSHHKAKFRIRRIEKMMQEK
jgi:tetratricopeptide (TPR) repeat protein